MSKKENKGASWKALDGVKSNTIVTHTLIGAGIENCRNNNRVYTENSEDMTIRFCLASTTISVIHGYSFKCVKKCILQYLL